MTIETQDGQTPLINPDRISQELRDRPKQWAGWRKEMREGRSTKVPYSINGRRASVIDPEHWTRFELAFEAYRQGGWDGLAFVFTPEDEYCGIDLDDVYLSDATEDHAEWAREILERFSDTYAEESPSTTGVKIWIRARVSHGRRWAIENGAVEIYDRARFFTVTGKSNGITVVADHQRDLELLIENLDRFSGRESAPILAREPKPVSLIGQKIPVGRRHNTLVSLAGTLWRRGLDIEEIEVTLLTVNERRCDPPYSPRHIHKLATSIQGWNR
jgi:putative DNA primase/helicase